MMIYEEHLAAAERASWPLDGIAWERIDREKAAEEPDVHAALYDAALIEGYLPVLVSRLLPLVWDDVDATAVLGLELFEGGLRHFTALKRYLERVGYGPVATIEDDLVEARRAALDVAYDRADLLQHLTNFMCSELFAARFFRGLARRTREPVLRHLLSAMARDEFRHSAAAGDLLRKRVEADPAAADRILAAAESFRHYGNDLVEVPVAETNDFQAILAINRKVRQVCGMAPTEHLKEAMSDAGR